MAHPPSRAAALLQMIPPTIGPGDDREEATRNALFGFLTGSIWPENVQTEGFVEVFDRAHEEHVAIAKETFSNDGKRLFALHLCKMAEQLRMFCVSGQFIFDVLQPAIREAHSNRMPKWPFLVLIGAGGCSDTFFDDNFEGRALFDIETANLLMGEIKRFDCVNLIGWANKRLAELVSRVENEGLSVGTVYAGMKPNSLSTVSHTSPQRVAAAVVVDSLSTVSHTSPRRVAVVVASVVVAAAAVVAANIGGAPQMP